jgi:alpha-tubulin suppressor-like RCC1 family protein
MPDLSRIRLPPWRCAGRLCGLTHLFTRVLTPLLVASAVGCREDSEPPTASTPVSALDALSAPPLAFAQVSAGSDHTCGVTTANVAYCWGDNELGQLGIGTSTGPEACEQFDVACSTRPVRVVRDLAFREVRAGGGHSCGVTTRNVAYCWGTNASGRLGNGSRTGPETCLSFGSESPCSTRPVRVVGGLAFRSVSLGGEHACGLTTTNVAYCWGINEFGQLGNGTGAGPETCSRFFEEQEERFACSTRPVRVAGGLVFRQVSAGRNHTCAVTTDDRAYCWGASRSGQLGNRDSTGPETCGPSEGPCSPRPVRVVRGLAFRQVSAGSDHSCGVTTGNLAYCWGANVEGELGHGTSTGPEECFGWSCSTRPVRVVGRLLFARVDGGNEYGCALDLRNTAYCWGGNLVGELGEGTYTGPETCIGPCSTVPVRVQGGLVFRQVSAGAGHTCGVSTGRVAYCWGTHGFGQLGSGRPGPETCYGSPCSTTPVAVAPPARR